MMGQLVGLLVQLLVGQLPVLPDYGDVLRLLLHLGLEQLMDTSLRVVGSGGVPLH